MTLDNATDQQWGKEAAYMKNYTQVYVRNSMEAAKTYCRAFGAEITLMAYAGGSPSDRWREGSIEHDTK